MQNFNAVKHRTYRQRPAAPHIVESQSHDGAPWLFEAECRSEASAREWIEAVEQRDIEQENT